MTPLKALHIDRRQHLELAWQRQQGEEELLKQHLTVTVPTVLEVRTLAHLDQLVDSAGSAIVLLYFYSKVEKQVISAILTSTASPTLLSSTLGSSARCTCWLALHCTYKLCNSCLHSLPSTSCSLETRLTCAESVFELTQHSHSTATGVVTPYTTVHTLCHFCSHVGPARKCCSTAVRCVRRIVTKGRECCF